MRQDVVWIDLCESLSDCNCVVVALQILQGPGQAVHGFGEGWIGGERLLIRGDSLFQMSLGHQVERGVVVVFGLLAGVWVRHSWESRRRVDFNMGCAGPRLGLGC